MRKPVMFLLLMFLACANVNAADQAGVSEQEKRDAQRLRALLPKMLESSDISMTHEALVIIRDGGLQPSDELLSKVVSTLQRLLKTPSEGMTRCLACEVLGLSKSRKAIPVLLDALADPYVHVYSSAGPGGHVSFGYRAVWREADGALREITGASGRPPNHIGPTKEEQEKTRNAWLEWYKTQPEKTKPDHPG